jgi:hypothetical protein
MPQTVIEHVSGAAPLSIEHLAARVVWWQPAAATLADTRYFLNHIMAGGSTAEVGLALRHFGRDAFRLALADPLPGIYSTQAWAFWHAILHHQSPPPPLPVRDLGDGAVGRFS